MFWKTKRRNKALIKAIEKGDAPKVRVLLAKGADVHARDDFALLQATAYGYVEIEKLLLEAGADIHADNDRALRYAAWYGDQLEIMKILLKAGANVHANEDSALQNAAWRGDTEVVKILLEAGADIHANNDGALRNAAEPGLLGNSPPVVKLLLGHGANANACRDMMSNEKLDWRILELLRAALDKPAPLPKPIPSPPKLPPPLDLLPPAKDTATAVEALLREAMEEQEQMRKPASGKRAGRHKTHIPFPKP